MEQMMVERFKQASKLIDYYKTQFIKKFNSNPSINRTKAKFQFTDVLCDFTFDEVKEIIDYYLLVERDPSINKFIAEYPDLAEKMQHDKKSDLERKQLLKETRERVMKFRETYGK